MRQILSILALTAALLPLPTNAAPARANPDTASKIDTYMRGRMPDLRTPGV
jgi:hypothetical protein